MGVVASYPMQVSSIDQAAIYVQDQLKKYKCADKDVIRAQLFAEETLLFWLHHLPQAENIHVTLSKRFKTITLTLSCHGAEANPLILPDDPEQSEVTAIGQQILIGLSTVSYQYENGTNYTHYTVKEKALNPALGIGLALAAATLSGWLVMQFAPSLGQSLATHVFSPFSNTYFGLLNAIVMPLLFVSVLGSIFNMENLAQVKRVFAVLLGWFVGISILTAIITVAAAFLSFPIQGSGSGGGDPGAWAVQLRDMLLAFVPTNIVRPFIEGNSLQIVFLAVISGLVMLVLKGRFQFIPHLVAESNLLLIRLLDVICSLMPLMIFIGIFNLVLAGSNGVLVQAIGTALVIVVCIAVQLFLLLLSVGVLARQNIFTYMRTIWPFVLIALLTASSSSTFSRHEQISEFKQQIRGYLVRFSLPIGSLFCKPLLIPVTFLITLFVGGQYGIHFGQADMISMAFISTIIALTAPSAPGTGALLLTILYSRYQVPMTGLTLGVALFTLSDYLITAGHVLATNISMLHTENWLRRLERKGSRQQAAGSSQT